MTNSNAKPPLNTVNVVIFIGLPLAAMVLVPAWGVYHGYDAFQWLWALAFCAEQPQALQASTFELDRASNTTTL